MGEAYFFFEKLKHVGNGRNANFLHFLNFSKANYVNSLPNDKILHQAKWKGFADDKQNVTKKLKFVLGRIENIV